jgi:hypothetical protein
MSTQRFWIGYQGSERVYTFESLKHWIRWMLEESPESFAAGIYTITTKEPN